MLFAAVMGGNKEIVQLIVNKNYVDVQNPTNDLKQKLFLSVDQNLGNTPYHWAYSRELKDIRKILRDSAGTELAQRMRKVRNFRGKVPREMLHTQKVLESDSENDGKEFLGIPSSNYKEGTGMIPQS